LIARGLRSNISITVAVLLFLGMVLINLVTILTVQRDMLRTEIGRWELLLSALDAQFSAAAQLAPPTAPDSAIRLIEQQPDVECLTVLDHLGRPVYSGAAVCPTRELLVAHVRESLQQGRKTTRFVGKTWGVFWLQDRYVLLTAPLHRDGIVAGAAGVATSLEGIYARLRHSQKIFLIYIGINTAILTFIALYRISRIYVDPLKRLANRAEDYREEDGLLFNVRKEDNELHQLSRALNLMLGRIAEDKEKLRLTVTSLEKANVDLKNAQKEIIRAEKLASVGRLSAGIAHEIGNPIGIVMGYLDLLKQAELADEEKTEYIQRTEDELNRINTIIRQLLDLSRPSKEGVESIQAHEIIRDISEVIKFQPLMSGIRIDLLLDAPRDRVLADPNQLRQVFLNLMLNAADAIASGKTPPENGGRITIRSAVEPVAGDRRQNPDSGRPMLTVQVSDNGPGIAEENLGNIFDPFFTTKEPGKGTGLGLSVSFMIIEGAGGHITAESQAGKGTTMTLTLPLADDLDPAADESRLVEK
jgi:signal transduction histidine kinase